MSLVGQNQALIAPTNHTAKPVIETAPHVCHLSKFNKLLHTTRLHVTQILINPRQHSCHLYDRVHRTVIIEIAPRKYLILKRNIELIHKFIVDVK